MSLIVNQLDEFVSRHIASLVSPLQTRCGDCGRFLPKSRWLPVNSLRNQKALCIDCYSLYEDPDFL